MKYLFLIPLVLMFGMLFSAQSVSACWAGAPCYDDTQYYQENYYSNSSQGYDAYYTDYQYQQYQPIQQSYGGYQGYYPTNGSQYYYGSPYHVVQRQRKVYQVTYPIYQDECYGILCANLFRRAFTKKSMQQCYGYACGGYVDGGYYY